MKHIFFQLIACILITLNIIHIPDMKIQLLITGLLTLFYFLSVFFDKNPFIFINFFLNGYFFGMVIIYILHDVLQINLGF